LKEDFVRNMSRKKTGATRSIKETRRQEDVMAELGREFVTATSKSILFARGASETGNSFLQKKSTISFPCRKEARTRRVT